MDNKYLAQLLFPDVTKTPEEIEAMYPERDLAEGVAVSRHAPSPTGFVHLGNVVQSLISERLCHQSGGILYLRIEDTDSKREVKGATESLINMLAYYGIKFDEGVTLDGDKGAYGPYTQSKRRDIYRVYAKKMVEDGNAYPCFCTKEELEAIREEQEKEKVSYGYYGKWAVWRDRPIEDIEAALKAGKPWVLRLRSTGSIENKFKYNDLIKGEINVTENDVDFVIIKSDGIPPYHFAHPIDDHLMHTTHVVRGDEWLATLPLHLQLHKLLGFKPPKYAHIGALMKMDGSSKRKLSTRKDPELGLAFYKSQGYPRDSVREYVMTVLNSNFEDWRRANPDADIDEFKFSVKKLNPAGSLFDLGKLMDISKNVISKMTAEQVYEYTAEWANEFDKDFYDVFTADPDFSKAVLAIGRGGNKPRKDFGLWSEVKGYMGFMFDKYFSLECNYDEKFDRDSIKTVLEKFVESYDDGDEQQVWFDKIKAIASSIGYAADMKEYKANPDAFKGSVADVSMFLRLAVTGKLNSPDMYSVMKILGRDRVNERIKAMEERL
ncbi:MAG: glutamate--tRNA ligase [Clostridia bacterium]|nr:glutamate--tRNA ligase [Clostridia bacterium]